MRYGKFLIINYCFHYGKFARILVMPKQIQMNVYELKIQKDSEYEVSSKKFKGGNSVYDISKLKR